MIFKGVFQPKLFNDTMVLTVLMLHWLWEPKGKYWLQTTPSPLFLLQCLELSHWHILLCSTHAAAERFFHLILFVFFSITIHFSQMATVGFFLLLGIWTFFGSIVETGKVVLYVPSHPKVTCSCLWSSLNEWNQVLALEFKPFIWAKKSLEWINFTGVFLIKR